MPCRFADLVRTFLRLPDLVPHLHTLQRVRELQRDAAVTYKHDAARAGEARRQVSHAVPVAQRQHVRAARQRLRAAGDPCLHLATSFCPSRNPFALM